MSRPDFLTLSADDRRDALAQAAAVSGRPAYLLEKDVWVVWTLNALFTSSFGERLVFKGGTSLSKVFNAIRRFSEDLDLTYDIRALVPDLSYVADEIRPASRKDASRISSKVKEELPHWLARDVAPALQLALDQAQLSAELNLEGESLYLAYESSGTAPGYVPPRIQLEFGGRSTGEPCAHREVICDAAAHLEALVFPTATPRVMAIERTFWEKLTAIHAFCCRGLANGERYSRHWHDVVRLSEVGDAIEALKQREVGAQVANHKSWFYRYSDVDYHAAVNGGIVLIPTGDFRDSLKKDWLAMVEAGLMLDDDSISFEALIERCGELQDQINAV